MDHCHLAQGQSRAGRSPGAWQRERVLKDWNTAPAPSIKNSRPFLSKSFVSGCSPSPGYPTSSNVWNCSFILVHPGDLTSPGPYLCPCHSKANLRMQALPWATLEGRLEASSSTAEHSCPSWEQGKLAGAYHTCAPCSELAASSLLGPVQDWLNIDKAGNELSSD